MLVGEPPFRGSTLTAVIANRLSSPVPSPRAFRELVPEAVDAAVRKAMATLPADRFTTASQFADALGTPATVAIAVGAAQAMVKEVVAAKSVAVLPFENMSTDPENEYFSDGITDDIIAQLSKISALKVISRTSSMQYKKTTKKITAIAQELGVGAILEGSVRKAGQRVRIVVHLVEPRTEKHLWGDTFDRQLTDIFEVQSEVAQQITGALSAGAVARGEAAGREEGHQRRRRVQPVSPRPLPREQVGRSGRAEGDRVLRGRHRQGSRATRSPTPAWPTPTSCSASGSAPSPRWSTWRRRRPWR